MQRHLVQSLVRGALLGHPDLGMAGGHRCGDLRRVGGGHEPHDHTGMLGAEAADDRGNRIGREGRERRHVEVARDQARDGGDGGGRRLDVAQCLAGRLEQRLARGRQRRAPPPPHEQVGAQLGLELPDASDTAGWATWAARAPAVKLPWSATARNRPRRRRSIRKRYLLLAICRIVGCRFTPIGPDRPVDPLCGRCDARFTVAVC